MINCDRNIVDAPEIKKEHRTSEILEKLGIVFGSKCYLCETKKYSPAEFEIDHFIPQSKDSSKKLDWNNLYLACGGTCNQYKSASFDDILDPCNPNEDVEKLIEYKLTKTKYEPRFYASGKSNLKIVNTCKLLDKIHNGSDNNSIYKTGALREAIKEQSIRLLEFTKIYFKAISQKNKKLELDVEREIKEIVSRRSPYTMLMRSEAKKDGFEYLFD